MKALGRSYVWWPGMDAEIENLVKSCSTCQESRPSPPAERPSEPWSRLHLDYTGPFLGHMYLVLVDAHLKWMDVQVMQLITSSQTIEKLECHSRFTKKSCHKQWSFVYESGIPSIHVKKWD